MTGSVHIGNTIFILDHCFLHHNKVRFSYSDQNISVLEFLSCSNHLFPENIKTLDIVIHLLLELKMYVFVSKSVRRL